MKVPFPNEFFNEAWAIKGDYKNAKPAEIKVGHFYSGGILVVKRFSRTLKNAYLC